MFILQKFRTLWVSIDAARREAAEEQAQQGEDKPSPLLWTREQLLGLHRGDHVWETLALLPQANT